MQPDKPTGPAAAQVTWPVRSGAVPPLADVFSARSETVPNLNAALGPGATVVLAPGPAHGGGARAKGHPGPTGKTQLAVAAAEGLLRSGGIELLVWITATTRASVLVGYVEASVAALSVPSAGDSESVAMRFVRWLRETSRRWLMVFDDLTDAAHLDGLWPEGPAGTVLVTTADAAAVPGSRHTVIPVGVFSRREALNYLMGRLTGDPDQRLGGIDLIEKLGYDPLALAQAAAVISSSTQSCRDYQDQFMQRRLQLAGQGGSQPPPTVVTWTLCVDRAGQLAAGHTAQFLLLLAALLDRHEIPGSFFVAQATCDYLAQDGGAQQADPQRAWNDVVSLQWAGLLSIDPGSSRAVRISAPVQEAVRAVIPEQVLDRAVRVAAAALLEIWPEPEPVAWLAGDLRSCAASLQRIAGDALWSGGCHPLLLRAGQSLDNARLTGAAVAYWCGLAATSERILGAGHPDTLQLMQRLATAYLAAGRPEQAVPTFQRALASSARALGPQHPAIAGLRIDLGRALLAAGEPRDAVTVLGEVATGWEHSHGPDDPGTLRAWDDYAAACMAAKQFSETVKSYRRTLAERERIQGARHPDTIAARQNLADACLADGQVKQALNQHKRAVADRERVAGRDHPDALAARSRLAFAYFQAGRTTSALQMFEQARADSERVLGADHPDTLSRFVTLADIYDSVGLLTDAKRLLEDTAERCERVLPPGDPLSQAVRESLARIAGR
ncbi:MAG TPA: tetratricopeptide repeat protein [Streptosporangiaceae bacterium]